MCHIVGESQEGPRGDSPLPVAERSQYSNLILLCAKHHVVIDKDVARFPVEVLHALKATSEQWVSETLSKRSMDPDPDELVYADLVDTIASALQLEHWSVFIDNAVRNILEADYTEARGVLNKRLLSIIWPKKKHKLEIAAVRLINSFADYVTFFISNAELRDPGRDCFYVDHSYARYQNPRRHLHEDYEDAWSSACFWLLCDFVRHLNLFCSAARASVNPLFFRLHGDFLIEDHIGYRNNMNPMFFKPTGATVRRPLAQTKVAETKAAAALGWSSRFPER